MSDPVWSSIEAPIRYKLTLTGHPFLLSSALITFPDCDLQIMDKNLDVQSRRGYARYLCSSSWYGFLVFELVWLVVLVLSS